MNGLLVKDKAKESRLQLSTYLTGKISEISSNAGHFEPVEPDSSV